jgi:hypothetical protein
MCSYNEHTHNSEISECRSGSRTHLMGWSSADLLEVVECGASRRLMKLHVLGIDLGKTVFHLVGLDSTGRVVIRKRCSRRQLLAFTANLEVQLIGMEACSGAHFLGNAAHLCSRLSLSSFSSFFLRSNQPIEL